MGIVSGGGPSVVLSASVTLTNAQIKALPTTPVQVIAAPAAGEVVVVLGGLVTLDATAAVYTNVTAAGNVNTSSFSLCYGNDDGQASAYLDAAGMLQTGLTHALIGAPNTSVVGVALQSADVTCLGLNVRFEAYNAAGAYTGGNAANTMKVTVFYAIVAT